MRVIFLDRDGVINRYPGHRDYVKNLKEFSFLPGALRALKRLTDSSFKIFIVSNQAGVAKGIYSRGNLQAINAFMLKKVHSFGAKISGVYYCTHKEDDGCECRKPRLGSIKRALKKVGTRPEKPIYFIGDSTLDVETGKNAGMKTILVLSGKEKKRNQQKWQVRPDFVAKDLLAATKIVLNEDSGRLRLSRRRS